MPTESVLAPDERAIGDLSDAPVEVLCAQARAQEANFVRGEPSDGAAGFELFRRAMVHADSAAWAAVIALYRGLLMAQTRRQVISGFVDEDAGACADRAFERFWLATRLRSMRGFDDLGSILKYLKMCQWSVLLDEARRRRRQACVPIGDLPAEPSVSADPSAEVDRLTHSKLWVTIEQSLRDEPERLVARLSFIADLTPRQIRARHPDCFPTVADVYRVKRNVLGRLRRDKAILTLLHC
jgi:DNA-directed RNA polymerase specialized sigma24 family protein